MKHTFLKTVAVLLAVLLCLPVGANAAIQETISIFSIDKENSDAWIQPMGGGTIYICFNAISTTVMDELGALTIEVFESVNNRTWSSVRTYESDDYGFMLADNTSSHTEYIIHSGYPSRYYKAKVTFWGTKNGIDTSYVVWTPVQMAH